MLHHNHYCKHCDRNFTCKLESRCLLEFDISKLHKCDEAKTYRKRMAIMLSNDSDQAPCAYNCSRACNHPAKGELEAVRGILPQIAVKAVAKPAGAVSPMVGTLTAPMTPAFTSDAPAREFEHSRSLARSTAMKTGSRASQ